MHLQVEYSFYMSSVTEATRQADDILPFESPFLHLTTAVSVRVPFG